MVKLIFCIFVAIFLLKEASADCSQDNLATVNNCYLSMFQTIQPQVNTSSAYFSTSYSVYARIFGNAYSMWEGYGDICKVQSDLKSCLSGVESCVNPKDMANVQFVKQSTNNDPMSFVVDYIKYNYICSLMNNTDQDTHQCYKDNLYNIPSQNCTFDAGNASPDCFMYDIYFKCVANYANRVCGERLQCTTQKIAMINSCYNFNYNAKCGICGTLSGATDPVANVCTEVKNTNSPSNLPTLSFSLLFFAIFVFQFFNGN